jgi:hypothetical protein
MKEGFLTEAVGGRRIEHIPYRHPDLAVDLNAPAVGVMPTIARSLDADMSVFKRHFAPHPGQDPMSARAWRKASAFTAARRGPHKP